MTTSDDQQEAEGNIVNLPDDEPKVIASLMQYLYSGEYNSEFPGTEDAEPARPLDASKIIITRTPTCCYITDRKYTYGFPHTCKKPCEGRTLCPHHNCTTDCGSTCQAFLCEKCCLVRGSSSQLLNHSKMYAIGDKYDVSGLKELACQKFTRAYEMLWNDDAFPMAIEHAFSSTVCTDIGLKSIIIGAISGHMAIVKKAEIQALVAKHSDLAIGILLRKVA